MWVSGISRRSLLPAAVLAILGANACGGATSSTSVVGPSTNRCDVSLSNSTTEIPSAGGNGSLTVNAARECSWSASAEAPWIRLRATSGQGPATVTYSVDPNPAGTPRRGRVVVSDSGIDISQAASPCRYDVAPAAINVDASASEATIRLSAPDGCGWNARSDVPWIAGIEPARGSGGATVRFAIAPNLAEARTGTIVIADASARVNQSAPGAAAPAPTPPPTPGPGPTPTPTPTPTCSYRLVPSARNVGRGAEEFPVTVNAPDGCTWLVTSEASWIRVADGRTGSGNGSFRLAVEGNTGAARTGTVRVQGETFVVQQEAGACTFSIKPGHYNAGRGPDQIVIEVTAQSGCEWTSSTNADWVTIQGGNGSGSGTVRLLIPANTGAPRSATVIIAGQTFTLNQEGPCTYGIKPRSYNAGRGPDNILIAVTTDPGCSWRADSTVSWVSVAEGRSGTGSGTVRLLVEPNDGPARAVTLSIAGQSFDLRQEGR